MPPDGSRSTQEEKSSHSDFLKFHVQTATPLQKTVKEYINKFMKKFMQDSDKKKLCVISFFKLDMSLCVLWHKSVL